MVGRRKKQLAALGHCLRHVLPSQSRIPELVDHVPRKPRPGRFLPGHGTFAGFAGDLLCHRHQLVVVPQIHLQGLIAPNVDVGANRLLRHRVDDIAQERLRCRQVRIQLAETNLGPVVCGGRFATGGQFAIDMGRGVGVPRQVKLRDHRYPTGSRVVLNIREIFYRVETGIAASTCGYTRNFRECFASRNLQTPPLVIREVQVQSVHLVRRQQIHHRLDLIDGVEGTHNVHAQSTPREPGHIFDEDGWDHPSPVLARCHHLAQCGKRPVQTAWGRGAKSDEVGGDFKSVGLIAHVEGALVNRSLWRQDQTDLAGVVAALGRRCNGQREPSCLREDLGGDLRDLCGCRISDDDDLVVEGERRGAKQINTDREWNQV